MGPRKGTLESSPESSQAYSAEKILERPAERLGMPKVLGRSGKMEESRLRNVFQTSVDMAWVPA